MQLTERGEPLPMNDVQSVQCSVSRTVRRYHAVDRHDRWTSCPEQVLGHTIDRAAVLSFFRTFKVTAGFHWVQFTHADQTTATTDCTANGRSNHIAIGHNKRERLMLCSRRAPNHAIE